LFEVRNLEHVVTEEEAGNRLDRVLAEAHSDLSRSRIQALITEGRLIAGGRTITEAKYRVKPAERLTLKIPPARPARPIGQDIPLDVVFEDEHLLVVDKPVGMVVHPAAGNPDGTLVNALIAHCGDSLSGIGGEKRPGIVHRLDKDTSGVMMVAKTDNAHIRLSNAIATRQVGRSYRALVWGVPQPASGEIEGAIGRSPQNRKKMAVVHSGGKAALTHYALEKNWGVAASQLACKLASGRTHQIRVHMSHIGHSVMGDQVYGARMGVRLDRLPEPARSVLVGFRRQALHAAKLSFHHPATNELLEFESPMPADMAALVSALDDAYLNNPVIFPNH
jgi:23S rRNA pseudouridine1911/1915/1917 synthase